MRTYKIDISNPKTGELWQVNQPLKPGFSAVPANPQKSTWTSLNSGASVLTNGGTNPNAQAVEIDIPLALMNLPYQTGGYVKIHGVSLAEISQASKLNNLNIAIYGGMAKGLPLANYRQYGLLAKGQIFKAQGNYRGTGMNGNESDLTIFIYSGGSSPSANQTTGHPNGVGTVAVPATNQHPGNIIFVWKKGQPLILAMAIALQQAFPMYTIQGSISENLVWASGQDAVAMFSTLEQFAGWIHERSMTMLGGYAPDATQYMGVNLAFQNNVITIFDGSTYTTPKQIQYTDLIGQPAWDTGVTVLAIVVLRGDIRVGDYVTLPPGVGVLNTNAPSNVPLPSVSTFTSTAQFYALTPSATPEDSSIFSGTFYVAGVRHAGKSRDANGEAWVTALTLNYIPPTQIPSAPSIATANKLPTIYTGSSATGYFLP